MAYVWSESAALLPQCLDSCFPGIALRVRLAKLGLGLACMTSSTQRLTAADVVRVLLRVRVQGHYVVDLHPAGPPARGAAIPIALQDCAAGLPPPPPIQPMVMPAHPTSPR